MACQRADLLPQNMSRRYHRKRRFSAGFSGQKLKKLSLPFRYQVWHNRIKSTAYAFPVSGNNHPGPHHWKTKIEVSKMASVALTRISGSVLSVPTPREGVFKPGTDRAGERWRIETVNVLVADQNVTAVTLPRRDDFGQLPLSGGMPSKGDIVDFLCEVSIYRQDLQVRVIEDWPADDVSNTLAA